MTLLYPWLYDCSTLAPTFEFSKYLLDLEYGGYNKEKKTTVSQTRITIIWLSALSRTEHIWDVKLSSRGHMWRDLPVMQETRVRSLGWEDPLEKETAIHSSILAWRIPRTEEPGGLQFTWSLRVRHHWVTNFGNVLPVLTKGKLINLCQHQFSLLQNKDNKVFLKR